MEIKYLFITLLIALAVKTSAQPENIVEKRLHNLSQTEDFLLYYHRSCGAMGTCNTASAYFLYKRKKKYIFEYYRWNSSSDKRVVKFKTKKKSNEISAVVSYIAKNYDSISKYKNFFFGYKTRVVILDEKDRPIDTIQNKEHFNDGPWVRYIIKFHDKILFGNHNGGAELNPYIRDAAPIGTLLLVLNMLYYEQSFDCISSY